VLNLSSLLVILSKRANSLNWRNYGGYALEKRAPSQQIGHECEQSSGGRCLFLFAVEREAQGRDVFQQLAHKLA